MSLHGALEAVEKKGLGHPDTLADDLAEALSRAYAVFTRERCGAILHHNFDKTVLLGGESEVRYGHGAVTRPIRCLVNGRVSTHFGGVPLGVEDLITTTARSFFARRLPGLGARHLEIELNLSTASSPGRVLTDERGGARHTWFAPRTVDDLRETRALLANDTSFGTGYAPTSRAEALARDLSALLSDVTSPDHPPWLGSDTKVMLFRAGERFEAVACVPILARETPSRAAYLRHLEAVAERVRRFAREQHGIELALLLNHRDRIDEDEIYLTAVGTSLETGDEGVVGRGNRVNGVIAPFRPMNIEGANGKNPVYHVGKLYNVAAHRIASRLHEALGGAVWVNLASATGGPLTRPWRIHVRTEAEADLGALLPVIDDELDRLPALTDALVAGTIGLS